MRCVSKEYVISDSYLYDLEIDGGNNNYIANGVVVHNTLCEVAFVKNPPEDKLDQLFHVKDGVYAFVTSKGLAKQGFIQKNTPTNQDNIYVKTYLKYFHGKIAEDIADYMNSGFNIEKFYVFGEVFGNGIQKGFTYGLLEPTFRVFDVYCISEQFTGYYNHDILNSVIKTLLTGLERVPVDYIGPWNYDTVVKFRDGMDTSGKHVKEGIVVRPVIERQYHRGLPDNRVQLKMVSPAYIEKSDGTEFN